MKESKVSHTGTLAAFSDHQKFPFCKYQIWAVCDINSAGKLEIVFIIVTVGGGGFNGWGDQSRDNTQRCENLLSVFINRLIRTETCALVYV